MSPIEKSSKLENVCYDIRGPVLKEAKRLEEEGNKVLKLISATPPPSDSKRRTKFWSMSFVICRRRKDIATRKGFILPVKRLCSIIRPVECAM